jgi:hypothetical protein
MEQMKQMYVEAIEMANSLCAQDPRYRGYLDFALERMELGLELNIPKFFAEGFDDLSAVSIVVHFNTFQKKVEA